jgi:predicted nuclease of predicted toxin-antitoxin system
MKIWIDAQLSPAIALWMTARFPVEVAALRDIGLRDADDREIFEKAREADAVVMTKDSDFLELLRRLGPPPKIILMACGNTSNARLKEILELHFETGLKLLQDGEIVVEIRSS